MRLLLALTLFVLAACAIAGCVRHVDLRPIDAAIDAPTHPDSAIDALPVDAADIVPDAPPDSAIDAM
jgi:hypothetical protein